MNFAPSQYWYAAKDGTPVKKYDTAGETMIDLPDGIDAVACDDADALADVNTDASVLSDGEREKLGVYQ